MNVPLTPELQKLARLPELPATKAELEAELLNAAASIDAGKGVDSEQVFARLRERSKARRLNA